MPVPPPQPGRSPIGSAAQAQPQPSLMRRVTVCAASWRAATAAAVRHAGAQRAAWAARAAGHRRSKRVACTVRILLVAAACALQLHSPAVCRSQAATSPAAQAPPVPALPSAASTSAASALPARPRIALVLSGGGARGFAMACCVPCMDLRVPVDLVVGTSMGSVVGGAYAAGASISDLERMARNTDWDRVVADRPAREDLEFRRREEDVLLPSRIEFGVPPRRRPRCRRRRRAMPRSSRPCYACSRPARATAPSASSRSRFARSHPTWLTATWSPVRRPAVPTMRASLSVPGVFAPVGSTAAWSSTAAWCATCRSTWCARWAPTSSSPSISGRRWRPKRSRQRARRSPADDQHPHRAERAALAARTARRRTSWSRLNWEAPACWTSAATTSAVAAGEKAARPAGGPARAPGAAAGPITPLFENNRLAPPPLTDTPGSAWPALTVESTGAGTSPRCFEVQSGLVPGKSTDPRADSGRPPTSCTGAATLNGSRPRSTTKTGKRNVTIKATEAPLGQQPPARGPGAGQRLRRQQQLRAQTDAREDFRERLGRRAPHA